ncbi:MAG: hypothetical protein GXY08_12230 [Ruminococcus sp.]|nr:hypothetical protein [Ruminococcus sp.]
MKKAIKISGIVLLTVVIMSSVIWKEFSDYLIRRKIERKYPDTFQGLGNFQFTGEPVPDDWEEISGYGLKIKVPGSTREYEFPQVDDKEFDDTRIYFFGKTKKWQATFSKPLKKGEDYYRSLFSDCNEEKLEKMFSAISRRMPRNGFEYAKAINSFTPDNIDERQRGTANLVEYFADIADGMLSIYPDPVLYEKDDIIGFIYSPHSETDIRPIRIIEIYPKKDLNKCYSLDLYYTGMDLNEDTLQLILESIELEDE